MIRMGIMLMEITVKLRQISAESDNSDSDSDSDEGKVIMLPIMLIIE